MKEQYITLEYPRTPGAKYSAIIINLCDVRAADGIRVSYDFDRDGWKVEQASTFTFDCDDPIQDPDWQEVAFVQAWSRERKNPNHGY